MTTYNPWSERARLVLLSKVRLPVQRFDRLSRTEVRLVSCPACEARPFEHCIGARGKLRKSNHQERVNKALGVVLERWQRHDV